MEIAPAFAEAASRRQVASLAMTMKAYRLMRPDRKEL
jgi:uncharacterized protein YjiS (DUF1127 family)